MLYQRIQSCQWDPHDRAGAGKHAGNVTNFTENCAGKRFFFSEGSRET